MKEMSWSEFCAMSFGWKAEMIELRTKPFVLPLYFSNSVYRVSKVRLVREEHLEERLIAAVGKAL